MSHGGFYIPRLFKYLPRNLEGKTILDAGHGRGEMGYYIHAFTDRPASDFHGHPHIVGLDIHQPSVDFTREWLPKIYDEVYHLDLIDVETWANGRHFDIALLLEVPEHVPKPKMLEILDKIERIADFILIATPYGDELNQDYGIVYPEFNHVSVWMPEDFKRRGYEVRVEQTVRFNSRLFEWAYGVWRKMFGLGDTQRKIIAWRNPRGVEVSKGLNFAGLKKW